MFSEFRKGRTLSDLGRLAEVKVKFQVVLVKGLKHFGLFIQVSLVLKLQEPMLQFNQLLVLRVSLFQVLLHLSLGLLGQVNSISIQVVIDLHEVIGVRVLDQRLEEDLFVLSENVSLEG